MNFMTFYLENCKKRESGDTCPLDSLHVLKLKLEIKKLPVSFAVSGILLNFFGDKQSMYH